jgi:hypothetical protein
MIGALLKQILTGYSHDLPEDIFNSLKTSRKNHGVLKLERTSELIKLALKSFNQFYICIDALDELKAQHRKGFLSPIFDLIRIFKHSARIFITGRTHMKDIIDNSFQITSGTIHLKANAEDIKRYVTSQLEMDENYGDMSEDFRKEILETIVSTADGMLVIQGIHLIQPENTNTNVYKVLTTRSSNPSSP